MATVTKQVTIIGAGLAGSEAAYYLASRGIPVRLVEMKPNKRTPAHTGDGFAELVCSNSLKSDDKYANACGLLKEEMRLLGSMIIEAADVTKVPAGAALAVDREKFSAYITEKLKTCPHLTLVSEEVTSLPEIVSVVMGVVSPLSPLPDTFTASARSKLPNPAPSGIMTIMFLTWVLPKVGMSLA